jgi:hypothetical protein
MVRFLGLQKSTESGKKYQAEFETDAGRTKTVHFGASGMKDYTLHSPMEREERKDNYISRHRAREDWNDPMSPGALSRWILWNRPTVSASLKDYKRRFGFT